ncbi:MAG: DUF1592 domain-containing protein [Fuerstia sp.]|nr:DUF1592 domain-containing protein [Fuerstiella sp.]
MSWKKVSAIFPLCVIGVSVAARSLLAAEISGDVKVFLEKHCLECHGAESKQGGLDLSASSVDLSDRATYLRWVRIHDRMQSGEMPPKDSQRPEAEEIKPVLEWLSQTLNADELQRREKNGRSVVRRMNRAEFENTLRDLLDVPWIEVQELLPEDGRADGYTKTAAALDISPVLLAKYGEAIDKALNAAVAKWSVPPEVERHTLYANQQYDYKVLMSGGDAIMLTPEMKYDESRFPMPSASNADGNYPEGKWQFGGKYKGLGEAEKDGVFKEGLTVGMTRTFGESFGGRFNFAPVHPGRYQIGVSAWSYWWDQGEVKPSPRSGSVGVYCGSRLLGFVDAPSLKPTYSELNVEIEPTEENHLRAAGTSFLDAHVYFSQGQIKAYSGAGVAIDKLVVTGPLYDEWPPTSHRRLFGNLPIVPFEKLPPNAPQPARPTTFRQARGAFNGPGRLVPGATVSDDPAGDARRLLATFLPRAFRRPVTDVEVQRYAAIADARGKEGASFEDALLESCRTALLSPDFLFLNEPIGTLDGYALASRLSYLLWNSCPDDALLAAAMTGTLNDPNGLRGAAERLLGDPKADRFYQDFPDQWLDLRDFDLTSPDKQLYPEFQPYLEDAMRCEPREFFKFAVRNRLPASQLLSTPINIVSQRLAEHYGIPGVEGTRFRRVDVDQTTNTRGGFLTMAAVCKVTANGTTTSPVKRGAWVMKKILGQPPQAPPPDVAAIEPDVKGATTIREQLARHREDTSCAGCHAHFDPPGFALESYDVIGGWREFYRATEGKKTPDFARIFRSYLTPEEEFKNHVNFSDGQPVDAGGELVDGRKFTVLREYQALLNSETPVFSRNLTNQLVVYATGAPVSFTDRPAVEEILKRAGGTNPNLNELLHQVIQSPLFLSK